MIKFNLDNQIKEIDYNNIEIKNLDNVNEVIDQKILNINVKKQIGFQKGDDLFSLFFKANGKLLKETLKIIAYSVIGRYQPAEKLIFMYKSNDKNIPISSDKNYYFNFSSNLKVITPDIQAKKDEFNENDFNVKFRKSFNAYKFMYDTYKMKEDSRKYFKEEPSKILTLIESSYESATYFNELTKIIREKYNNTVEKNLGKNENYLRNNGNNQVNKNDQEDYEDQKIEIIGKYIDFVNECDGPCDDFMNVIIGEYENLDATEYPISERDSVTYKIVESLTLKNNMKKIDKYKTIIDFFEKTIETYFIIIKNRLS